MTTKDEIISALSNFDLDEPWHSLIYTEPNELVAMGFPAEFIIDQIDVYESSPSYIYQFKGTPVKELIGVALSSLIWQIAEEIGADTSVAGNFTGEGFRTEAIKNEIKKVIESHEKDTSSA
jgi:hypothetical protein